MTRSPGGADNPEDIDAAFAEIIEGLRRDTGGSPPWPEEEDGRRRRREAPSDEEERERELRAQQDREESAAAALAEEERERAARQAAEEDEGHFEPPEPPPLPRPKRSTVGALALIGLGLLLLVFPSLLGLSRDVALPLGLLVISAAVGLLLLKLRQGGPPGP
uniref:hypothetical protein n=1 Tax=Actinoalloteichus spitiensis TaxID=252394 RepID=UPI00037A64A6